MEEAVRVKSIQMRLVKAADLQYTVDLSFEEAIFGVEKEIKFNREEICHTCGGNGAKPGTQPELLVINVMAAGYDQCRTPNATWTSDEPSNL